MGWKSIHRPKFEYPVSHFEIFNIVKTLVNLSIPIEPRPDYSTKDLSPTDLDR